MKLLKLPIAQERRTEKSREEALDEFVEALKQMRREREKSTIPDGTRPTFIVSGGKVTGLVSGKTGVIPMPRRYP